MLAESAVLVFHVHWQLVVLTPVSLPTAVRGVTQVSQQDTIQQSMHCMPKIPLLLLPSAAVRLR
jgi:hypothetical protein